jgi:hypothetical protein
MTDASKVTRFCAVIRVRAKQQIRRNQGASKTRKLGFATKGESRLTLPHNFADGKLQDIESAGRIADSSELTVENN